LRGLIRGRNLRWCCDGGGVLVVMAGLPGSGKSAVAEDLAAALGCAVLSVDPVEAAMWRAGVGRDQPTGLAAYVIVEVLAAEQLALGHDVIHRRGQCRGACA